MIITIIIILKMMMIIVSDIDDTDNISIDTDELYFVPVT